MFTYVLVNFGKIFYFFIAVCSFRGQVSEKRWGTALNQNGR